MQIIPAIIPKSFDDLVENLSTVKGLVSTVHIDVTDGKLGGVPSWPFVGDKGEFVSIKKQERGFPFWEDFDFEVHLMTQDSISLISEWIEAGATRIIMHVETLDYKRDIQFLDQIKTQGVVEMGIAINADTEAELLTPFFEILDFVQVMTIPQIGLQGAPFDSKGLEKLKWLKQNHPNMIVSIDGAMNPETIEIVMDAGADRAVVGSYIFGSENPRNALEDLQGLV